MGLNLNPNADAPDGCAGPVYAFRLTNLEPGIGYRVRVSSATGGGDYRTRCRSKADSAVLHQRVGRPARGGPRDNGSGAVQGRDRRHALPAVALQAGAR